MKKYLFIFLFTGLLLGGYIAAYFLRYENAYSVAHHKQSELQWLKKEFRLTETQFAKIQSLHASYIPMCDGMCRDVKEANLQLENALKDNDSLSPDVQKALERMNHVKNECQKATMEHVYSVSKEMSPEEGKRFVKMMGKHIFLLNSPTQGMPNYQP